MPKGRNFVPQTERDGIWFRHRGSEHLGQSLHRDKATSTGIMLSTTKVPYTHIPAPPPPTFHARDLNTYNIENPFSEHDNRHSFQTHGVYLEDGRDTRFLGRRLVDRDNRQHKTDTDYLKHHGKHETDYFYASNYTVSHRGDPCEEPPKHRRFARNHPEPQESHVEATTTTTSWLPPSDFKNSTRVLAISQVPYQKQNVWKYSNHGLKRVYPPYDRLRSGRCDICPVPGPVNK